MKTALTFEDRKQFLLGDHVSNRFCYLCGKETLECMGSVNATTFLQALQGEITFDEVKELCSTCTSRFANQDDLHQYPSP